MKCGEFDDFDEHEFFTFNSRVVRFDGFYYYFPAFHTGLLTFNPIRDCFYSKLGIANSWQLAVLINLKSIDSN